MSIFLTQQQADAAAEICHKITVHLEMLNQDLAELKASVEDEIKETQAKIDNLTGAK